MQTYFKRERDLLLRLHDITWQYALINLCDSQINFAIQRM